MGGLFPRKPQPAAEGRERRRAERIAVFDVTELYATGTQELVTMKDISLVGIRFSTSKPMARDTVVKVRIQYNPIDFPLRAMVVWSRQVGEREWDHGAEFVNIPPDEKLLLADHIEELKAVIAEEQAERAGQS